MKLNLVEQWFKPSRILDIGASIGLWHAEAKQQWPDAYMYSIEANFDCEPWLQKLGHDYKICLLTKDENNYDYHKKLHDMMVDFLLEGGEIGMSVGVHIDPHIKIRSFW